MCLSGKGIAYTLQKRNMKLLLVWTMVYGTLEIWPKVYNTFDLVLLYWNLLIGLHYTTETWHTSEYILVGGI